MTVINTKKRIPEGWRMPEISELGKTYTGLSGKTSDSFGGGSSYFIPYMNIFQNSKVDIDSLETVIIERDEKQNKVKYGDIFFTTSSETPEEVGMSSVLLDNPKNTYLNSFCFGFRLNDFKALLPQFAKYVFRSQVFRRKMFLLAQGSTRHNLAKKYFLATRLLLPPIIEQPKLSEILSSVDEAIEKTDVLIGKYKRVKQGLMQDLFHYGIDEQGQIRNEKTHHFKDSPLGRIPEEWKDERFNNISKVRQGLQIAISQRKHDSGKYRFQYITIQYLNDRSSFNDFIENPPKNVVCSNNDILLTRTGNTGMIVTDEVGVFHNNFFLIDFDRKKIVKEWLVYYLNRPEIQNIFMINAGTTTIPDLKHGDFYNTPCIYPNSLNEQSRIASVLTSTDKAIKKEEKHKQKLLALRRGLMDDLLSGTVRVNYLIKK